MRRLLALLMVLGLSATVAAQNEEPSDDERAAMHFRAAESYFSEESFEQALIEFQAAHRLSDRPELVYNIGLTLERLGRWDEAADAHEEFLEVAPDHPDASEARTRMERARERAARERETGQRVDPGSVDDAIGGAPDPGTTTNEREPSESGPGTDEPEPSDSGPGATPWVVLGASAAVGVVALGTGLAAHGIHGDLEDDCPGGVCSADRASDVDKGQALARTSTALTFVALAGAVTGVVLFFVGGDGADDDGPAVAVAPTRGGGYVESRWSF